MFTHALKCEEYSLALSQKYVGSEAKPGSSFIVEVSPRKKSTETLNKRKRKVTQSESALSNTRNAFDSCNSDDRPPQDNISIDQPKSKSGGKSWAYKSRNKQTAEKVLVAIQKKRKKMLAQDVDSVKIGPSLSRDMKFPSRARKEDEVESCSSGKKGNLNTDERLRNGSFAVCSSKSLNNKVPSDPLIIESKDQSIGILDDLSRKEELVDESPGKREVHDLLE